MKTRCSINALLVVVALMAPAKADLIVNGGFETGDATGWTTANVEAIWSGVTPFVTTPHNLGFIHPHSGTYYASLSNDNTAAVVPGFPAGGQAVEFSQSVVTTPGQNYNLAFFANILASDNYPYAPGLVFEVLWNNSVLLDINNPAGPPVNAWVNYSFSVVGTGTDTVSFFGANQPAFNGLDDVSLNASTPLPGNLTMCGIAAVLVVGANRFRRRLRTFV